MAIKGKLKPQFDPVALAVAADPHWFGRRVKPKPKSKT
jgi:hypothetical protein